VTLFAGPVFLALAAVPQGTLQDASVRIAIAGDTARIVAEYQITGFPDSIRFNALRLPSQVTEFDRPFHDPETRLDTLPGLFRLTAPGRSRTLTVGLRYAVSGDLSRIPLFVPETPTRPGQSRIAILVDGLAPERAARFVVPRFTRDARGVWRAEPDHLPSLLALVRPERGLPVPALAQWSVLLVVFGGTAAWLLTQLAARRST
jgi:hypothetical protein